jgi:UDP-glucose 4-epimerase
MKILISGGAGFIGSNLIKELVKDKSNIIISIDNYSTGSVLNHIDGVKYINGSTWDIFNIKEINDFFPNYVYHFGEYSRISESLNEPSKTIKSNILGTQQILEYCIQKKSKLIYSGSSAIFGNNGEDQHLNPYAWTKSKNIELIKNYKEWYNLDFCICYFYNVYGSGQIMKGSYATVIGIFENQYINNEKLTVVEPGTQTRCFTYIDDIIDGILIASKNGNGDDYHIGSKDSVSILEIVKMFDKEYVIIPKKKGERYSSELKESKMGSEFSWNSKIKLIDYINNFKLKNNGSS